mmetsp:Transcript_69121/g.150390  ORF Transcript_69121/g.150390 Transcript_69121/m.150390 type:complete len:212 (+) Transcript_69121:703-1338(+)
MDLDRLLSLRRVEGKILQLAVTGLVERAEVQVCALRQLHFRKVFNIHVQALHHGFRHLHCTLTRMTWHQLLVVPAKLKCRAKIWVWKVDEGKAQILEGLLIPGAEKKVEVAPHNFREILKHGQQCALSEVSGDVCHQISSGSPRRAWLWLQADGGHLLPQFLFELGLFVASKPNAVRISGACRTVGTGRIRVALDRGVSVAAAVAAHGRAG